MPVIFVKASKEDPIGELAGQLEGRLRLAFLRAVKALKDQITLDALAEAIRTGDITGVMTILALSQKFVNALKGIGVEDATNSFQKAIQDIFAAGATTAAKKLPITAQVGLSFDLMNPETVNFLQGYTFPLIQDISQKTEDGIRNVLIDAFQNGGHPFDQARKIKGFIGLTRTQSDAVLNYRKALEGPSPSRAALQRALRDGRFDRTVDRAIRNSQSLSSAYIDKMVERYQQRYLQYRAQSIARTESIRASNKGQHVLWSQAKSQGLLGKTPKRKWIISGDSATCDECLSLDGIVVGLDEEFAPGIMDPGDVHTNCRCSQALVF